MAYVATPDGDDAWLRTLFMSLDEACARCDMALDADGHPIDYLFLEVNRPFEEMTGLLDPVGRSIREMVPDIEQAWINTYARVGLNGERMRFAQEPPVMGHWFDVSAVPCGPTASSGSCSRTSPSSAAPRSS